MLPISVTLTMRGVNKTTFAADKAVLEMIIADITNSSSAESTVIEYLSSITKWGDFVPYLSIICQRLPLNSSEVHNDEVTSPRGSCALVQLVVRPRDAPHEQYALLKMNDKTAFRNEINERLMNQITEGNLSVISVGPIERIPGLIIRFKLPYRSYGFISVIHKFTQIRKFFNRFEHHIHYATNRHQSIYKGALHIFRSRYEEHNQHGAYKD